MKTERELRALAYLQHGWTSRRIRQGDVERLMLAEYHVSVVVPLVEGPTLRTRVMTGLEILDFLKAHGGECGELLVGIEPVGLQTSAQKRR
jgi:hypothetical protein